MRSVRFDREVPPHELFNARNWKIAVTLNPKSEADIVPGAGLTRRVPAAATTRFSNWVVGSGNGVTLDMRGNRTGSVDFNFDSEKLILDSALPCERETISYHSLTKNLGIKDWLYRSVRANAVADLWGLGWNGDKRSEAMGEKDDANGKDRGGILVLFRCRAPLLGRRGERADRAPPELVLSLSRALRSFACNAALQRPARPSFASAHSANVLQLSR
ncbi:hypothetical protein [Bradyrhizobium lablabi]|uniref:hypothetical protein n=1 Tax=Bradyrhizobium lablabi TaxID=722472 RepID=UPI0012E3E070|nr:hypothetical protein [Bradyrhizobium lablabi]